jgi:hypothetical protein
VNIQDMIKDSVDELAHRLPPRPELADDALRQARRHTRVVRLAVAGGATLAVAATAAISGIDFTDPAGLDAPELGSAAGSPQSAAGTISLDELPVGESPAVPWLADGALHIGNSHVPFDVDVRYLNGLLRVEDGYFASVTPNAAGDHEAPLYLVPDDGTPTMLADGWVPDVIAGPGNLVAWSAGRWDAEFAGEETTTTLTVADATTGDVLHERQAPLGRDTSVVGFLDENRILVSAADNSDQGVYVWDLAADTIDRWMDGYDGATALTSSGGIGAFVADGDEGTMTTAVVDTATDEVLWTTTNRLSAHAFSPDGRFAVFFDAPSPDDLREAEAAGDPPSTYPRRELVVVETQSGDEVARFDAEHPERFAWEPDGSLVFEAWQDSSQMALVRCDLDGDCELATEPRATNVHPDAAQPPYHLGDNY